MRWLGCIISLCVTLQEIAKLFYKASVPFYIPTNSVWEFQLFHRLARALKFLKIVLLLADVYFIVVLICIYVQLMMLSIFAYLRRLCFSSLLYSLDMNNVLILVAFEVKISFFLSLFILKEWASRGEVERQGERIPSRLCTVSVKLTWGSISWTVRSWPEPKPRVGRLTNWATQALQKWKFL